MELARHLEFTVSIGVKFTSAILRVLGSGEQMRTQRAVTDLPLPLHNAPSVSTACVLHSAAHDTICCVISLTCDASAGAENSDMMISSVWYTSGSRLFKESRIHTKRECGNLTAGYMDACYHGDDDNGMMLSDG